jgi:group I intron endonuclease
MDSGAYTVYVHINKTNGKRYYGQTKRKATKRWEGGKGYKKNQPVFYNAIQKYGWDGFEHIIVKEHLTLEEANRLESELIAKYKTLSHENGYNILYGGGNKAIPENVKEKIRHAHLGKASGPCSEERKHKIGAANRGRTFSEEARKRMSEGQKGKKYSEEYKRLKSEQMKQQWAHGYRKPSNKPSPQRRPVIAFNITTEKEVNFESITKAAEVLNIQRTYIESVLTKRQKTTKGYRFRYAEEVT